MEVSDGDRRGRTFTGSSTPARDVEPGPPGPGASPVAATTEHHPAPLGRLVLVVLRIPAALHPGQAGSPLRRARGGSGRERGWLQGLRDPVARRCDRRDAAA